MRVIVVADTSGGVPDALAEAQAVANAYSHAGHRVRLLAGDEASLDGLGHALDSSPFDLAWFITHSSVTGITLSGEIVTPAQLGQWLAASRCWEVVLNACYSVEHVMELQRAAPVDVVATLSPAGVLGPEARTTGIYLARAHALSGDLEDATRRASGNGAAQYRWFPQGGAEVQGMRGDENNELAHRVDDLVRALQGDPFSGAPGLLAQLSALSTDMRAYMAETDRRLRRLEQQRLHPHHLSIVLVALLVAAVLLLGVWGVR